MIALKHILVPTDFSEPSTVAMRYAKAFAETFSAGLHVVHVIEDPQVFSYTFGEAALPMVDIRDQIEKNVRAQLESLLTDDERARFAARLVTLSGSPFVEIVRYAKTERIDLIIMGTHGRGPIAHMLLGSVAERVVRKAPCPVLTIRQPEHEFIMP